MDEPMLRVLRGEPTAEELAALVAVLSARSVTPGGEQPPSSLWRDHAARLGLSPLPGPLAWRASGRPH